MVQLEGRSECSTARMGRLRGFVAGRIGGVLAWGDFFFRLVAGLG